MYKKLASAWPCGQTEANLGAGRSPLSLSHAVIRRPARLTASRRHSPRQAEFFRPHSRAVQRLAAAEFRVRPLSSLRLALADAGLRTRSRHVCDCGSASSPVCFRSATAVGGALARSNGSGLLSLQVAFRSHAGGAVFNAARLLEGFHWLCHGSVSSPRRMLTLSRLSASFFWLYFSRSRQSYRPVLVRSSNRSTLWVTAIRPNLKPARAT